eukprot:jgi/Galph1/5568/GphlegSOOS_G4212.1
MKLRVTASAPGKVLLVGGYLVLERPNVGLVVTTSARFQAVLEGSTFQHEDATNQIELKIVSPQLGITSSYNIFLEDQQLLLCYSPNKTSCEARSNRFVECAVASALALVKDTFKMPFSANLYLKLLGDDNFYSNCKVANGQVTGKTGLGSSAALVVSIVGAVAFFFGFQDMNEIHAAAQLAHATAQGNIGSGFDVSASLRGSQSYVRFTAESMNKLPYRIEEAVGKILACAITSSTRNWILDETWRQWKIILGRTTEGSDTRDFVKKVLDWRLTNDKKVLEIWSSLSNVNEKLIENLQKMSELFRQSPESFKLVNDVCSNISFIGNWRADALSTWKRDIIMNDMHETFLTHLETIITYGKRCRFLLRHMGELSQVPIEPTCLTDLLDETAKIPGCILVGVPGAGGYDAIYAIVLDSHCQTQVQSLWNDSRICHPLSCRIDCRGLLVTKEVIANGSNPKM